MEKKKKLIISASVLTAVAVILTVTLTLVFVLQPALMAISPIMRDLYRMRFDKVDYNVSSEKGLVREISAEKPLNLVTFYDSADTVVELWETIPEDIRAITVINFIPGNFFKPDSSQESVQRVLDFAKTCDEHAIPYAVQVINGETHYEWQVPVAWIEQNLCKRQYFYGLNAAELYNGEEWRGQLDGDVSLYYNNCIRLMAKYGQFFFWTDTNIFGTNGTIVDWIEENEFLYDTMKECSQNIIMQNKESYGSPSSCGLMKGLYMAGLIGGWGVATDWWHWQVDGTRGRYDVENGSIDNAFEQIFYYPENMQAMSLAMVAINGGFCYKNEAEYWSVAVKHGDKPYRKTATFEYSIYPFLLDVLSGRFAIPTREQLLENEPFAVVGGANYYVSGYKDDHKKDRPVNYDFDESNLYPNTPQYNIIPLLPSNLKNDEKQIFDDYDVKLVNERLTEEVARQYANSNMSGDTYMTGTGGAFLYLNNVENDDIVKRARAERLYYDSVTDLEVESAPHTYVYIKESEGGLSVNMNNFRLKKDAMTDAVGKDTDPKEAIYEWVSVDGEGKTRASMDDYRTTVVRLKVDCKPNIKPTTAGRPYHLNEFIIDERYDELTGVYTVTVRHNGYVSFDIETDTRTPLTIEKKAVDNYDIANKTLTGDIYGTDIPLTYDSLAQYLGNYQHIIESSHLYTETSFHAFYRAYSYLMSAVRYKTVSTEKINGAIKEMTNVRLLDISQQIAYIDSIDVASLTEESAEEYDRLLYALLSPTKHYNGKDYNLRVGSTHRKSEYTQKVYRQKSNEIDKYYRRLQEEIRGL